MGVPKIKKTWKSIDALRGYYGCEIPEEDKERAKVIELSYVARNPEDNEKFLKLARELLEKQGFKTSARFLPISNIFAMNVCLIAYKDRPLSKEEKEFLDEFEDDYIDFYTRSFSIFTGETYPIDFEGFKSSVEEKAKSKLKEVV